MVNSRGGAFFMAILTYTAQLESVQAAIAAIESGAQAYTIASRSFTSADLGTLYQRETWLRGKATQEADGRTGRKLRYIEFG